MAGTKKTHFSPQEFHQAILKEFPNISATTILTAKQRAKVKARWAGCQELWRVEDLEPVLKQIREGETEIKNGFLLFKSDYSDD